MLNVDLNDVVKICHIKLNFCVDLLNFDLYNSTRLFSVLSHLITIKLGYNDHRYNEYMVITYKISCLVWFSMF